MLCILDDNNPNWLNGLTIFAAGMNFMAAVICGLSGNWW